MDHARQALLRSFRQQPPSSLTFSAPVDLCQRRQIALRVPAPQFGATCLRLEVDKPDAALRLVTLADGGQPEYAQLPATPQHAGPWIAPIPDALPVRSPGAHLHPQLRRAPGAGRGEAGCR